MKFIRKYWPEIIAFVAIFAAYILDCAPSATWINVNSDGVHLTFASQFLYLAHKTSAPLFLLLGHAFQWIPIGTEFWRMALMSVIFGLGTSIMVYLTVKQQLADNPKARLYAMIGAFVYAGSAIAFSQSVVVKYYTMVAFFSVAAYYFAQRSKWKSSAAMLGLGLATHHLAIIPVIILFISHKSMRHWKPMLVMCSFLLFYLYFPFSIFVMHSPSMWGNTTLSSALLDLYSTFMTLVGGLSIWEFPQRVINVIYMVGISLTLAIIPMCAYFWNQKKHYIELGGSGHIPFPMFWRTQLFWLFILPIAYFATDLDPCTYTYMTPAMGFAAIIAGIGLSRINGKIIYAVGFAAIAMFAINTWVFDIGRTLDPNLSATEFYTKELTKIPDGQVLLAQGGWDWAMVYAYNKNEGRNIIPIYTGVLYDPAYQKQMADWGIKFREYNDEDDLTTRESLTAASIAELNPNVWTTVYTSPETYGEKIVPTNGSGELLLNFPPTTKPYWKWNLVNPYAFITGSVQVKDWKYNIYTYGTRSMAFFIEVILIGVGPYILYLRWQNKRKQYEISIQRKARPN